MIVSFGDKATSDLFHGISSNKARKLPNQIHELALYKLDIINAAQNLDDLKSPPGNRLEPLKGDLKGFHSIRIKDNRARSRFIAFFLEMGNKKAWFIL